MDSIDENNIKATSSLSRSTVRLLALIIGVQILAALIAYPFLPDMVPSHWNIAGQVDSYLPKFIGVFLMPGITLVLSLLLPRLTSAGLGSGYDRQRTSLAFIDRLLPALALFFLGIQLIIIATALHFSVNVLFIISLLTSLLFIYTGNFLGKLRRNQWSGIRTPWTLANDTVWERTHRLGGWLFVVAGLIGVITSFIPPLRLWGVLGSILLVSLILSLYSYLLYRRLETNRQ